MTINAWLDQAIMDAERRGLAGLPALLEALARSTATLRSADWNDDATGQNEPHDDAPSARSTVRPPDGSASGGSANDGSGPTSDGQ